MSITDEDRGRVNGLLYQNGIALHADVVSQLAAMIATEREKARAPFLALNPMAYCNTQSGNGDAWDRGWVNAMQFITDELRRTSEDS